MSFVAPKTKVLLEKLGFSGALAARIYELIRAFPILLSVGQCYRNKQRKVPAAIILIKDEDRPTGDQLKSAKKYAAPMRLAVQNAMTKIETITEGSTLIDHVQIKP